MFKTFLFFLLVVLIQGEVKINIVQSIGKIPPADDAVCMARYIVHNSDWCSLAYISTNDKSTAGDPLSRIFSISDGTANNSTGTVYFMVSPFDLTVQDLFNRNNCSVIMSLAETHYCQMKKYDAQDPRCAQVILTGYFEILKNDSQEYEKAKTALWTRHPAMKYWYYHVPSHKWIFARLQINHIAVVDMFGGRKFPSVYDYYHKICSLYVNNITESGNSFSIKQFNDTKLIN